MQYSLLNIVFHYAQLFTFYRCYVFKLWKSDGYSIQFIIENTSQSAPIAWRTASYTSTQENKLIILLIRCSDRGCQQTLTYSTVEISFLLRIDRYLFCKLLISKICIMCKSLVNQIILLLCGEIRRYSVGDISFNELARRRRCCSYSENNLKGKAS